MAARVSYRRTSGGMAAEHLAEEEGSGRREGLLHLAMLLHTYYLALPSYLPVRLMPVACTFAQNHLSGEATWRVKLPLNMPTFVINDVW